MKQLISSIAAIIICLSALHAQTLPVKLYEYNGPNKISAGFDGKAGKELNAFAIAADANGLRMYIKIPATPAQATAQYQLQLMVIKNDDQQSILNQYWNPLRKDSMLAAECFFPAGDFTIRLVDKDHPEKPFASRAISVKGTSSPGNISFGGFSYDRSKFKIWTCKSVDETAWKPVGQTSKVAAGSCLTFFFESTVKIKNPGTMRWKLYKVGEDGKETFVNQREQNSSLGEYRRLYYEECDELRTKGKYRIYFAVKNESEAYYGIIDKDYFASADFMVE